MDRTEHYKLDNPAWHSLNEQHSRFCVTYGNLKCYDPAYAPFGGYVHDNNISKQLDEYSKTTGDFFIIGEKSVHSERLLLRHEMVCLQMVAGNITETEMQEPVVRLNDTYEDELFQLVTLVQPGYFKRNTSELGCYYGIFREEKLVAVTGERMQMNGYTELSAIVTHPEHTGRGYAKQLIAHVASKVFAQNKIPFLHVTATNTGAIKLYEKMGFVTRRKISFWNMGLSEKG